MSSKKQGRVKWYKNDKGFGFIEVSEGADVFLHSSQVSENLKPGDLVEFLLKEGKKGPVATEVKKVTGS